LLDLSVLIEHFAIATAALSAGRREGGVMAETSGEFNRWRISQLNRGFSPGRWGGRTPGTGSMAWELHHRG